MRIIAIDPGYERLGIAVLEKGSGKETLLYSTCFKTSAKDAFEQRLTEVGEAVRDAIERWKPEALAIEKLYIEKNQKTAMRVAEARGVIICEAAKARLRVHEFTPLEIKVAITGYGKADKRQMMQMVRKLVKESIESVSDDEFDAIAAGLTCFAYGKK
ncbi:crossover junction endodeoxyribonuclease RuvC [Candidatus Parcubacteria bacterium]|nr:crossover junction endodeoxyribonuclease RuvC [Candidatus Parcubacteria bacterium]